jgi:hypothetical protein
MQGDDSSLVPESAELLEALSRSVVRGRSALLSCHELILNPRFGFAHFVSHNSVGLKPVGNKPVGHRPLDRIPIQ